MVSAVILTHNSQRSIAQAVQSVLWCDEIIIVDDNSTDETKKSIQEYPVKWYLHDLDNNFASQRNFGLEKSKNEWVLYIDDDEVVPEELAAEIKKAIGSSKVNGYYIPRVDYLFGKKMSFGETAYTQLLRLAKKSKGKWVNSVHEVWEVEGETASLNHALQHNPHPTMYEFIADVNVYSTLRAQELYKAGSKGSVGDIVIYPLAKFIQNYLFRFGFRDGIRGAILAFTMSFHSFLVRSKLYVLAHS